MAYFSENDINEAKRRVSDMQKRANRLTNQDESVKEPPKKEEKSENKNILKDERSADTEKICDNCYNYQYDGFVFVD